EQLALELARGTVDLRPTLDDVDLGVLGAPIRPPVARHTSAAHRPPADHAAAGGRYLRVLLTAQLDDRAATRRAGVGASEPLAALRAANRLPFRRAARAAGSIAGKVGITRRAGGHGSQEAV